MAKNYEQLGKFYLGREYSLEDGNLLEPLVLYDSPDLTTHAMIVGMTGSGKTGLGITLLEEALMDNIPLIAIDPKGDLANLLLTFDALEAKSFQPWVDEQAAATQGMDVAAYAQQQADLWTEGLAQWGQAAKRIRTLRSQAELAVYTPGSSAGLPISVLRSFEVPPQAVMADGDLKRDRIQSTIISLLTLLGIEADPITSREHILLANILETAWDQGNSIDLAGLIQAIQTPPFEQIGVMKLDLFYPAKERFGLAMQLNNLLASPGFETWLQGEPLDIQHLLYTTEGKPRAAIFSIAHLSDRERMFFTTLLLNALLGWMRTQSGTGSLRALLYMDEIFGYLPPVANPPSKRPLLTLLKQARAFGIGLVLSTQNPVDLDYKALSNMGTWCIGRLQTERDKARLIEGLRGVSGLDTPELEELLGRLGKRVFLLHNVHEDRPVIFQTRWTMSYLCGPMTREQIKQLNQVVPQSKPTKGSIQESTLSESAAVAEGSSTTSPPIETAIEAPKETPKETVIAADADTYFLAATVAGQGVVYQPAVVAAADVNYLSKTYGVDEVRFLTLIAPLKDEAISWDTAVKTGIDPAKFEAEPLAGATFASLPKAAEKATTFAKWEKAFLQHVRQQRGLTLYRSRSPKLVSDVGEDKAAFTARLQHHHRELRDVAVAKLQQSYATKLQSAEKKLLRAEQTVERKAQQAQQKQMDSAIALGSSVLGAFMGRKTGRGRRMANSVGRTIRTAGKISQSKMDVQQAQEKAVLIRDDLAALETELKQAISELELEFQGTQLTIEPVTISPKSTNITQQCFGLLWLPYRKNDAGKLSPDW
ncbi:MAG: DUF87 domain-containing protein [Cyanobacteria bacterium P01_F01_bin.53]